MGTNGSPTRGPTHRTTTVLRHHPPRNGCGHHQIQNPTKRPTTPRHLGPSFQQRIWQPRSGRHCHQHARHRHHLCALTRPNKTDSTRPHHHVHTNLCRLSTTKSRSQPRPLNRRRKSHQLPGRTHHPHSRSHHHQTPVEQHHQHTGFPIHVPRHRELLPWHTNGTMI